MLYKLAALQIGVYLILVPLLRIQLNQKSWSSYDFLLSGICALGFFLGGMLTRNHNEASYGTGWRFELTSSTTVTWSIWSVIYCAIAITFGLTNRRIGTEVAAELFASFPLWALIAFRTYEVALPFVVCALLLNERKTFLTCSALVLSLIAFGTGGALFSRSAVALLVLLMLVCSQNLISRRRLRSLIYVATSVAVIAGAAITVQRAALQQTSLDSDFFSREFLERLDGLEVASTLSNDYGTFSGGIEPAAITIPIIASLGFLPGATELKAAAVTTIKSFILISQLELDQKDINSFYILDAYFIGGWWLVAVSSLLVGALCRRVDRRIFRKGGKIAQCVLAALAINLIVLEREFVGILIGTTRDTVLIFVLFTLMGARQTSHITNLPKRDQR